MASPGGGSRGAPKGEGVVQPSTSSSTGRDSTSRTMGSNETTEPKRLTIGEIDEITNNLSAERLIGQGGFGKVYRGVLDDEDIAVKVPHNNVSHTKQDKEFEHEFNNLLMLNHPNIVRLVGYCFETQRQPMDFEGKQVFAETTCRELCFEYMHKGSLEGKIYDESRGLDRKTRYKIIKGACEGLKYLHEGKGSRKPIYHLDLKPDNILLDKNMTPKLADFGLSKLCVTDKTRKTQRLGGTYGYMAPEYLAGIVSNKVDVFSMGVVITMIIAGPEGRTRIFETSKEEFHDQVCEKWRKRLEATCTSSRILDAYCEQVSKCTEIGLNSMENERENRPSIMEIIDRLDKTETMIEKAISLSAISRSSVPAKSQREKHDDMVKLEAFARNKAIQFTETCDEFPILVRVTGAPWRRADEIPWTGVDVVLAFNVRVNTMKDVMMMLVDRLSPDNRLSIVFCGAQGVQHITKLTYMSDHGRQVARLKINELVQSHVNEMVHPRGRSIRHLVKQNFSYRGRVLPKAAQILRQRGVEESGNRAGCILHVWAGRMRPEIHKQDISQEFPVHTIAIGGHEPRHMKQIADMTSGTYDTLNWSDLRNPEKVFTHIASLQPRPLRITLQADVGVTISSIASGRYSNLVSSEKLSAAIDLQYIYAGVQKTFIVYLTVPQGKEKLLTIGSGYQSKEVVVAVLRPRRKCLPDEMVIHPKVEAELLRIRLMEGIARQNQDLSRNSLRLLLDEIKNSETVPEEILSDLEEEVAEMTDRYGEILSDSDLEEEGAEMTDRYVVDRESMLSSLNCHQLQLATTKGTPPNTCAFQILEQQRADALTNLVKIKGFTSSTTIMAEETWNEFPVLVRVTVAPWRHGWEMQRYGVDVVAVLDISRNMQVEKLEHVQQAMMIVIEKLGSDDRLSIVLLHTRKLRLMELTYMSDDHDHGRDAARFKITQLEASSGGCTGHIASTALQEGAKILQGRGEERSHRRGCMILLSDGEYPEILQIKISPEFPVHTFGLGVDHNPVVMKYIAETTSGTYSFVDQDISNIKDALALFITGLTSIAVSSIKITLRAYKDIAISSIESGKYIHHVQSDRTYGEIIIDHIYAGEQKDFIVKLIVGRGTEKLMTIGGRYRTVDCGEFNSFAEMDMTVMRPRLPRSNQSNDLTIQPDVAAELTRIRLQNGVLHLLDNWKVNARVLQVIGNEAEVTAIGLQQLWKNIKYDHRGAPEETLSALRKAVAEMKRDIPGMPYTLSWLSCHKWQRATTKGKPNNSSPFRTIGQYAGEDTNLVKVVTFTRSKAIPSDDPCNRFPILVRVMAAPWRQAEEMPHAGVDVVAVLDASAGMQGEKLERIKEAMKVVIGKLRAEDRLSIVSFNTYENRLTRLTYMTDHGRDIARGKINKLVAGGQGNIAVALREGAEILWWREAESTRRVGCIMFLSDSKNYEILEREIRPEFPVHTFGLGTDHNPRMMKYIADITSGTYSFVNQDIGMIKYALALFITGLTSVTAMSIKITLRTNEGITISSIESGGYVNHMENNQLGTIDIANIYAGERKDFIVYLRVAEGKKELMTIGGRYLSHATVKHLAYTDIYVQRPHQEVLPEDLAIQPEVAAELVRIRLEKSISTMLEKGQSIVGLQQLWEEIMDTDEGRGAPKDTMSGLSMDVTEMKRDIENPKESGLRYTLSWLTSRKWQRATIKGTPQILEPVYGERYGKTVIAALARFRDFSELPRNESGVPYMLSWLTSRKYVAACNHQGHTFQL